MTTIVLTQASSGAPVLNGVNGSMCAVFDWALTQNGFAIEYTAANARIYRAATGHRRRLHVRHDSAVSGFAGAAIVRGCEDASDAVTLIDPFPTVVQRANNDACWLASNAANSTARDYLIILWETGFLFFIKATGTLDQWSFNFFGDMPPENTEDDWSTACSARGTTATNGISVDLLTTGTTTQPSAVSTACVYFCRDITGVNKSTRCVLGTMGAGAQLGTITGMPVARAGYANRIEREKVSMHCSGGSTGSLGPTQLARRAWLPNCWAAMHSGPGSLSEGDDFTDTAYDAGALFKPIRSQGSGWVIAEISDTWSPPSG